MRIPLTLENYLPGSKIYTSQTGDVEVYRLTVEGVPTDLYSDGKRFKGYAPSIFPFGPSFWEEGELFQEIDESTFMGHSTVSAKTCGVIKEDAFAKIITENKDKIIAADDLIEAAAIGMKLMLNYLSEL